MTRKFILAAAATVSAALGLACAAHADPWDGGRYYGNGYYSYVRHDRDDWRPMPAGPLFEREQRLQGWIESLRDRGAIAPWQAGRAWRMLGEARDRTRDEAREHQGFMPPRDYAGIDRQLDQLQGFLRGVSGGDWR